MNVISGVFYHPLKIRPEHMVRNLTLFIIMMSSIVLNAQEFRAFDGVGNNLSHPEWGAANTQVLNIVSNGYADLISAPAGADRPNPRYISNTLFAQEGNINSALKLSDYVWVFGQFIDHDITLVENQLTEPLLIPVPAGDPFFDPTGTGQAVIPMFRNHFDPNTGTGIDNPRTHVNAITAFVDGSSIYGSDEFRANWLRSFENGKLKTSEGNLLPFNTVTGNFNDPIDPTAPFMADDLGSGRKMFVAGDIRANENVLLISFHTLFVREHNRLCDELVEKFPSWPDEKIYHHARKIVIGQIQSIVYDEWLPAMGVHLPEYQGYRANVNPAIFNVFSAAAFRLGHTLLSPVIKRMGPNGETISQDNIGLRDAFFQPLEVVRAGGLDPYFKGMGAQIQQDLDCKIIDDVRNFLFGAPGAGGLDLASINIMRGRERGLPDYNQIRRDIGLPAVTDFAQICSNPDLNISLEELYESVDHIDPWVGMLAEDHMPESLFGPTIMKIMELQFEALRDGDRFYYEIDPGLDQEEIQEIKSTLFSDIIRRNTDIKLMQDNVFFAMEHDDIPFANVMVVPVALDAVVFPNPVEQTLNIKLYSFEKDMLQFDVYDLSGKTVENRQIPVIIGENTFSLNLNPEVYTQGIYFAHMTLPNAERVIRFVKK